MFFIIYFIFWLLCVEKADWGFIQYLSECHKKSLYRKVLRENALKLVCTRKSCVHHLHNSVCTSDVIGLFLKAFVVCVAADIHVPACLSCLKSTATKVDRKKFVQLLFSLGIQLPAFTNLPTGLFVLFHFGCTAFAFLEACAWSANEVVNDILSNSYLFILLPLGSSEISLRLSRPADLHHRLQGSPHHIFGLRAGMRVQACGRVRVWKES